MSDNPLAFPSQPLGQEGLPIDERDQGMTLRDWFAGQALCGFFANAKRPTTMHADDATWCYTIADAMLAERAKVSS